MQGNKGSFKPRSIDRLVFAVLAVVCFTSGLYVVGPWYLEVRDDGNAAPLYTLFQSEVAVNIYGYALIAVSLMLFYSSASDSETQHYSFITGWALLLGFLLRLYSFIGVALALDSWRPPTYLSHLATVVVLGAYWVWVRVNDRTTQ